MQKITNPNSIVSEKRKYESSSNSDRSKSPPSKIRRIEVSTESTVFSYVNENITSYLFNYAHNDETIMTLACTSKDYDKAVHNFLAKEIRTYGALGNKSNNPFNGIYHFIRALSQNLNISIPINLYISSCKFLLDHTRRDEGYDIIRNYNELCEKILQAAASNLYYHKAPDNTESDSPAGIEDISLRYNDEFIPLNFSTLAMRFISLKLINTYILSKSIFEDYWIDNINDNSKKTPTKHPNRIIGIAQGIQSDKAFLEVYSSWLKNACLYAEFHPELSSFEIVESALDCEIECDEKLYPILQEVCVSVIKNEAINFENKSDALTALEYTMGCGPDSSLTLSYIECFYSIKPFLQLILNQNHLINNPQDMHHTINQTIIRYYQGCLDCSKQNIRDLFDEQELEKLQTLTSIAPLQEFLTKNLPENP